MVTMHACSAFTPSALNRWLASPVIATLENVAPAGRPGLRSCTLFHAAPKGPNFIVHKISIAWGKWSETASPHFSEAQPEGLQRGRRGRLIIRRAEHNDRADHDSAQGNDGQREVSLTRQQAQYLQAYESAATAWVLASALHMLSFCLLNPASWTTRAMFSLSYSHFLLVLLSIRSLCVAVTEGLCENATYQRLNLALASSAMLAGCVSVSKYIFAGVAEVAVPATSAVASGVLVLVCLRVWLMSTKSTHHLRSSNPSLSTLEQGVMALIDGAASSAKRMLNPKRIDGVIYRGMAVSLCLQAAAALCKPGLVLSLINVAPQAIVIQGAFTRELWEGRVNVAIISWASTLVFQAFAAFCLACGADKEKLSQTVYKDLNAGMVVTLVLQGCLVAMAAADTVKHVFPSLPIPYSMPLVVYLASTFLSAAFCVLKHPFPRNLKAQGTRHKA